MNSWEIKIPGSAPCAIYSMSTRLRTPARVSTEPFARVRLYGGRRSAERWRGAGLSVLVSPGELRQEGEQQRGCAEG